MEIKKKKNRTATTRRRRPHDNQKEPWRGAERGAAGGGRSSPGRRVRGCRARPRSRSTISPSQDGLPAGEAGERLDRVRRPHWPRRGGGWPGTGLNGNRRTARPGPRGGTREGQRMDEPPGRAGSWNGADPCRRARFWKCASPWRGAHSWKCASPWVWRGSLRRASPSRFANPWKCASPWIRRGS